MKKIIKWSEFLSDAKTRKSMIYRPGLECVYDGGILPQGMESGDIPEGSVIHLQKTLSAAMVPGTAADWLLLCGGSSAEGIPIQEETGEEPPLSFEIPVGHLLKIGKPLVNGDVLTLSLSEPPAGYAGKYMVEFFVKDSGAVVVWPEDVSMPGPLALLRNCRYQVCIIDKIVTNVIKILVPDYFYVENADVNSGSLTLQSQSALLHLSYSRDKKTWTDIQVNSAVTIPQVKAGDRIYLRGTNEMIESLRITANFQHNIGGDITTMLDPDGNVEDADRNMYRWMFYSNTNLVDASNLILPAASLAQDCYNSMFYECSNLEAAPNLPTRQLAKNCYYDMFQGCSSLAVAPQLPARTLAESCYGGMFRQCSSLTQAPDLPATSLAKSCYGSMFQNCSSLSQAPLLPATTLADSCYSGMFWGSGLQEPPALPATTLTKNCYFEMFNGCSSLVEMPQMGHIAILNEYCCYKMFAGCTALVGVPDLPHGVLASNSCYRSMFAGCTSLEFANVGCLYSSAESCCSRMFFGCSNLAEIKIEAYEITASNCFQDWVKGVAPSGYFANEGTAEFPYGDSGIPFGWVDVESNVDSELRNACMASYRDIDTEDDLIDPVIDTETTSTVTFNAEDFGPDYRRASDVCPVPDSITLSRIGNHLVHYVFWYQNRGEA